jgi:hypothetical protein
MLCGSNFTINSAIINKMKTYTKNHAEVTYNLIYQGVLLVWKDYSNDEQFKSTIETALELAKSRSSKCWIEEMALGKFVSNASTEWVKDEVFSKVAQYGIRKVAFLLEQNTMRKLYIEKIKESIQMAGLQFGVFETRQDMDIWLREQEPMKLSDIRLQTTSETTQYY